MGGQMSQKATSSKAVYTKYIWHVRITYSMSELYIACPNYIWPPIAHTPGRKNGKKVPAKYKMYTVTTPPLHK